MQECSETFSVFYSHQIRIEELLPYLKSDEVEGYCRNCPKYGAAWSCPPHTFEPDQWVRTFNFAVLMVYRIQLDPMCGRDEMMDQYYRQRSCVNQVVRLLESIYPDSVSLYAGHCDACETCKRLEGEICAFPEKCRYSLESLGFKVSDITEGFFGISLQWAKDKMPDELLTVPALLLKDAVDLHELEKVFIRKLNELSSGRS